MPHSPRVLEQREVRLARLPRSGFLRFRDALLEARDVDDLCLVRERRTHGDEVIAVVDLDDMFIVELQRLDEALAQLRQEVQRAAEEGDVAAYRPALREVANGLIDDRLEIDSAISAFSAPSFMSAWISVLAKTPQREAIV